MKISSNWGKILIGYGPETYSPKVELDLCDNPPIFSDDVIYGISKSIFHLATEVNDHTEAKQRRVRTSLDNERFSIELAWDGTPLSPEQINEINNKYSGKGRYSGSQLAGGQVRKLGGKITIENFLDNPYTVRNIIEIPIDSRS